MNKLYKIIIIFEIILVLLFLLGYVFYEDNIYSDKEGYVCSGGLYPDDLGEINLTNNNIGGISVLSDKKEDLNS